MKPVMVAPSMMCANKLALRGDLAALVAGGVGLLHVDVMDGSYVPNFAMSSDDCKALAGACAVPLDIHLMIEDPDRHIDQFARFVGAWVTIHPETTRHPVATLQKIRGAGARAGIAIDPAWTVDSMRHLIELSDHVCVMTVNPGFAGQTLVPHCLDKIREVAELIGELGRAEVCRIEVDGNVSWENIPKMLAAGADVLVGGTSSVFDRARPIAANLARLHTLIEQTGRPPTEAMVEA